MFLRSLQWYRVLSKRSEGPMLLVEPADSFFQPLLAGALVGEEAWVCRVAFGLCCSINVSKLLFSYKNSFLPL